jgi:hypothetical protein
MKSLLLFVLSSYAVARPNSLTQSNCDAGWDVGQPKMMQDGLAGNYVEATTLTIAGFPASYNPGRLTLNIAAHNFIIII